MTAALAVGLTILAAMASPLLLLIPIAVQYRAIRTAEDAFWADLARTIAALHADVDNDARAVADFAAWTEEMAQ